MTVVDRILSFFTAPPQPKRQVCLDDLLADALAPVRLEWIEEVVRSVKSSPDTELVESLLDTESGPQPAPAPSESAEQPRNASIPDVVRKLAGHMIFVGSGASTSSGLFQLHGSSGKFETRAWNEALYGAVVELIAAQELRKSLEGFSVMGGILRDQKYRAFQDALGAMFARPSHYVLADPKVVRHTEGGTVNRLGKLPDRGL